jgi:hypothetical protein
MIPAAVLTSMLVGYLYGHAQMTQAGFLRVKLQKAEQALRSEQNALITLREEQSGKDTIDQWALAHGFVKTAAPPIVLQSTASEGRN